MVISNIVKKSTQNITNTTSTTTTIVSRRTTTAALRGMLNAKNTLQQYKRNIMTTINNNTNNNTIVSSFSSTTNTTLTMTMIMSFQRNNSYLTASLKPTFEKKDQVAQAPNRETAWSEHQRPKSQVFVGPKFEQKNLEAQPNPPAAIELIAQETVIMANKRIVSCNGGGGALGHPEVYINLDQGLPVACGYCGNRFQLDPSHH